MAGNNNSGGARVGAGRKKKPLAEKIAAGNPGGRKLGVLDIRETLGAADLEGVDMPPVKEYLSAVQRDGKTLCAAEIFKGTWTWLTKLGCDKMVNPHGRAICDERCRWVRCEAVTTWISGKASTSNAPIQSHMCMSQNYMKQTQIMGQIFRWLRKLTMDITVRPQDDVMERLLTARRGK